MPPYVSKVGEIGEQLPDDRPGLPAVWTLEIAVLDQRHGGISRASNVVSLGVDRVGQVDDDVRLPKQGPRTDGTWQAGRGEKEHAGDQRRHDSCREDTQ